MRTQQQIRDEALEALRSRVKISQQNSRGFRCNSPLRAESDDPSFAVTLLDDTFLWYDHVSKEKGNAYQMGVRLGLWSEGKSGEHRTSIKSTKRAFASLAEYAEAQGTTEEVFKQWGWEQGTRKNRPALIFKTRHPDGVTKQERWRYMDGEKPRYEHPSGYKSVFYGLPSAIKIAEKEGHDFIILVNGEAGVVATQGGRGLPSFAVTGGEGNKVEQFANELKTHWNKRVIVALDCDDTGRSGALKWKDELSKAGIEVKAVDLELTENGDFANFAMLWGDDTLSVLQTLGDAPQPAPKQELLPSTAPIIPSPVLLPSQMPPLTISDTEAVHKAMLDNLVNNTPFGRVLEMPFEQFNDLGGYGIGLPAGKLVLIAGVSSGFKTSFSFHMMQMFAKRGARVWYVGWEHDSAEMHIKSLRWHTYANETPVTFDELMRASTGGQRLSMERLAVITRAYNNMKQQRGSVKVVDLPREGMAQAIIEGKRPSVTIEYLVQELTRLIKQSRAEGQAPDAIFVDYASLFGTIDSKAKNEEEQKIEYLKGLAVANNTRVFTMLQVNKDAGRAMLAEGDMLEEDDFYGVRADKANFAFTINVVYESELSATGSGSHKKPYRNDMGELIRLPMIAVNIVKNNEGKTRKVAFFRVDYESMRFHEGISEGFMLNNEGHLIRIAQS